MTARFMGATVALVCITWLAGCAAPAQQPLSLSDGYFTSGPAKTGRIGVVMSDIPRPDTQFPGAGCLLCMGVANMAHSALSKEVQAFSIDELKPLPAELVDLLKKKGIDAVLIAEPLKVADLPDAKAADPANKARKDYSSLKGKHKIDRLLVVNVTSIGVWRSYSGYVPTDLPAAVLNGNASLVELNSNALDWYLPLNVSRRAEGNWDEPPRFPGLSNAYYQVLESVMDMVKKPFVP